MTSAGGIWTVHTEPESGRYFYFNARRNISQYGRPIEGFLGVLGPQTLPNEDASAASAAASPTAAVAAPATSSAAIPAATIAVAPPAVAVAAQSIEQRAALLAMEKSRRRAPRPPGATAGAALSAYQQQLQNIEGGRSERDAGAQFSRITR